MLKNPNFAIIGAGAVGSFYGAKLLYQKYKVEFQSKTSAPLLKNKSMTIKSIWGDFEVSPLFFENTTQMSKADVIILSMKVLGDFDYLSTLTPILKKNSIILCLFNGINEEKKIKTIFPNHIILGGLAFTCINRISAQEISHTDYGMIKIGANQESDLEKAKQLANIFNEANIKSIAGYPLRKFRWQKLLWNIPFNSLSVILNKATTDKIIQNQDMLTLSKALMYEVQKIANHEGYKITNDDIEQMIINTQKMEAYKTSMMIDYENNKPMEVETILGEPIKMAKKYKIKVPNMMVIYQLLRYYNS